MGSNDDVLKRLELDDIKKRGLTHYSPACVAKVAQRDERERRAENRKRRKKRRMGR